MCTRPITEGENTFACRVCDECVATRIDDWVDRLTAEKQVASETTLMVLTYRDDENGEKPLGAKVFRYADVQRFLKALRRSYKYHYEVDGEVRYAVAGERGHDRDRVHWHIVLYSDKPLLTLGEVTDLRGRLLEQPEHEYRYIWSLWPHGFVYTQEPDQGGMRYAMKYALKDQFTAHKSKDTFRETRSDLEGAGMFRMSKKPPIGQRALEARLSEFAQAGTFPTHCDYPLPRGGYWHPKGKLRELYLRGLGDIRREYEAKRGMNPPTWSALLGRVLSQKNTETLIKEMGWLEDGTSQEGQEAQRAQEERRIQFEVKKKREQQAALGRAEPHRRVSKRCGSLEVCSACRRGFDDDEERFYRTWLEVFEREARRAAQKDGEEPSSLTARDIEKRFQRQRRVNPFCRLADISQKSVSAFPSEFA